MHSPDCSAIIAYFVFVSMGASVHLFDRCSLAPSRILAAWARTGWAQRWFKRKYKVFGMGVATVTFGFAFAQSDPPYQPWFWLSYLFFSASAIGAMGEWLTSSAVRRHKRLVRQQRMQRSKQLSLKWVTCLAISLVAGVAIGLSAHAKYLIDLSRYQGPLIPANDPSPSDVCAPNDNELAIYFGTYAIKTAQFPLKVLSVAGKTVMTIDRDSSGNLLLSVDVTDRDENIIARIRNSVFTINRNNILTKNHPDRSTLIVEDQKGREALNARFSNPNVFQFSGIFYKNGHEITVQGIPINGICFSVEKGATIIVGTVNL